MITVENGFGTGSVILVTWLKPGANESANEARVGRAYTHPLLRVVLTSSRRRLILRNRRNLRISKGLQKMCLQSLKLAHRMRAASDFNQHFRL
jgi:hypothetical protein